ncbi:YadA family autotransporter adhesin [Histophilus somni]|uniref:YadA family autotransporter adhesin n=1 Tax=Histophilus somni TaxID=731 RepID=UPI0021CBB197|nr:YadA-like family protein [Histophilus somni]
MNMNKTFFPLSLTAVMIFSANVAMAQAGKNYFAFEADGTTATGTADTYEDNIAVGKGAKIEKVGGKAKAAIAVGFQAIATGNQSIAAGYKAKTTAQSGTAVGGETEAGNYASAFGQGAKAKNYLSTAIGWGTKSLADRAVAVGSGAEASGLKSVSIGNTAKALAEHAVAIGNVTHNHGKESVAIGYNNTIEASSNNTVAVGNNIKTTATNSVFLGDSSAYVEKSDVSGGIGKVDGNYAGADAKGVVSVGSKGNERRIQNVAAGLLSHRSTDAVNGSQLHATNQRVEEVNKDAKAGIATAMAFKEVPFVPGKWSYAAGAARYSSESAVSLNLGRTSKNGKYAISGGMSSDSRGRLGFRVGVSGVFN